MAKPKQDPSAPLSPKGVVFIDLDDTSIEGEVTDPRAWFQVRKYKKTLADQLKLAQDLGYDICILTARPHWSNKIIQFIPGLASASEVNNALQKKGITIKTVYSSSATRKGLKQQKMAEVMKDYPEGSKGFLLDDQSKQFESVNKVSDEQHEARKLEGNKTIQAFDINYRDDVLAFRDTLITQSHEIENKQNENIVNNKYDDTAYRVWLKGKYQEFSARYSTIKELNATIYQLETNLQHKKSHLDPGLLDQAKKLRASIIHRGMEAERNGYKRDVVRMNNIAREINTCLKKAENKELTRDDIFHFGEVTLKHHKTKKEKLARFLPFNRLKQSAQTSGRHLRLSKSEGRVSKTGVVDSDPDAYFTTNSKIDNDVFAFMKQADKSTTLKREMYKENSLTKRVDIIKEKKIIGISWQGGGVKGLAALKTLKQLEKANILNGSIANVGSSVGSIQATAFSLGARASEMTQLMNINLKELAKDYKKGEIQEKISVLIKKGDKISAEETRELTKLQVLLKLQYQRFAELKKAKEQNKTPISKRAAFLKKFSKCPGEKLYLECQYIVFSQLKTLLGDESIQNKINENKEELIQKINDAPELTPEQKASLIEAFEEILSRLNENNLIDVKLTFRHHKALQLVFPDKVGDLAITGTNLETKELEYYDYKNTPHMEVARAMRISSGLPPVFAPFENYQKQLCCDGGLPSNSPTDYLVKKLNNKDGLILALNYDNKYYYTPESVTQKESLTDKTGFRDKFAHIVAGIRRADRRNEREAIIAGAIAEGKVLPLNMPHGKIRSSSFNISNEQIKNLHTKNKSSTSHWLNKPVSRYAIDIPALHNKLLKMSDPANRAKYRAIDFAEFKNPFYQQALLSHIKKAASQFDKPQEKLEYLQKVEASPLYDILHGHRGSKFYATTCKQQFDHLLERAERACGIKRLNIADARAQSMPHMMKRH